ncbi:MAG: TonB-dependent receptor [Gammaproteobacteria bacterium]|nr:TonB-dependent receptor [Gammaproteobacteria bacterium]
MPVCVQAEVTPESSGAVITVTGTREETLQSETAETVGVIDEQEIDEVRPAHPSEIMNRVSGVHVNQTNGEGHMTAIRQPITTKAVYLYLEDGIPTRSTGFFNHNALYEVNIPQASGIEVTKGPGTALYGSDAIGGVINVLTRPAPLEAEGDVSLELGEYGWRRALLSGGNTWGDDGIRADLNLTHTDGWRDGTEYDRESGTLRWDHFSDGGSSLKTILSASNIEQQTAGTSRLNEADYNDNPTTNYYPISYRNVKAVRLSSAYEKETTNNLLSITPYYRHNYMDYMPNWSFGYDPSVKETESNSLGALAKYRMDFAPNRTRLIFGADLDYTPGSRLEHSIDATKNGSIYDSYTVTDVIYDYDVTYSALSPYMHVETSPSQKWRLTAGLRYDYFEYDYTNNMADGLLQVTPSSMNGRTASYNHPSDTTVNFSHLSPKLGAAYEFSETLNGFISYRHAFRAPSESNLFRPGSNAESLNLDAVKADSYEIGVRAQPTTKINYEVSVYTMLVDDDLVTFEDPVSGDRTTVNAGKTSHTGVELGFGSQFIETLRLDISYSYAKHIYEDWVQSGTDFSGNEMVSAPRSIGNARLGYTPGLLNGGRIELELVHLGSYWMDQANTEKYGGYDAFNLRINHQVTAEFNVYARVMNLTDEKYATAATLSRGNPEFAPAMPRTIYAGVDFKF